MEKLYNNQVCLSFDQVKHKFTVEVKGKSWTPLSVTAITGIIDKPMLLPWGIKLTREYLHEHLPVGKELSEVEKLSLIDIATKQHQIAKDNAGGIGTAVHNFAELVSQGKRPALPTDPQALNGATAFLKWVDEHNIVFIEAEYKIYSLKNDYAGIADCLCLLDGVETLIDYKTSSGVYPEMFLQVAGYRGALEEMGVIIKQAFIAHFDKNTGEFKMIKQENHKKDFKAFLSAKVLKDRLKELSAK